MAFKTKNKVSRRAKLKSMAYGFRRRVSRFRRPFRRSFRRSNYSSINLLSMKGKSLWMVIILAVLGFVFKDKLTPIINKLTGKDGK